MSDSIPARVDLTFIQGATFRRAIPWKDGNGTLINTATYTGRLQVRATPESAAAAFPELTTANGGILVGKVAEGTANEYNILIYMPHTALDAIADWGRGVYDLEIIDGIGDVWRIYHGLAFMARNITR